MNSPAIAQQIGTIPAITLDDVRTAATRISGAVAETPCLQSYTLSKLTGEPSPG